LYLLLFSYLSKTYRKKFAMTECTPDRDLFPACKSRKIAVDFHGGHISSDGGSLLLRQMDRKLGLTRALDKALADPRRLASCEHSQLSMLRQRIYVSVRSGTPLTNANVQLELQG
jgi:hypothetical protein